MSSPRNPISSDPVASAEATLRLIANLPAPDGLAERIQAGLKASSHQQRVIAWPTPFLPVGGWVRGAAAAAIVCVVAGGGWTVYTRVQSSPSAARMYNFPAPPAAPVTGAFSSAGAKRVPDSPNGTVMTHSVVPQENRVQVSPQKPIASKKSPAKHHATPSPVEVAH